MFCRPKGHERTALCSAGRRDMKGPPCVRLHQLWWLPDGHRRRSADGSEGGAISFSSPRLHVCRLRLGPTAFNLTTSGSDRTAFNLTTSGSHRFLSYDVRVHRFQSHDVWVPPLSVSQLTIQRVKKAQTVSSCLSFVHSGDEE